jgi:cystathionine beta-lyase
LTGNRDFIIQYLEENLPDVRMTKPDATYLLWLDCSALKLKPTPYEFFLREAKVALSNGTNFEKGGEQFIRLNFGTTRRILMKALERVRKSLR